MLYHLSTHKTALCPENHRNFMPSTCRRAAAGSTVAYCHCVGHFLLYHRSGCPTLQVVWPIKLLFVGKPGYRASKGTSASASTTRAHFFNLWRLPVRQRRPCAVLQLWLGANACPLCRLFARRNFFADTSSGNINREDFKGCSRPSPFASTACKYLDLKHALWLSDDPIEDTMSLNPRHDGLLACSTHLPRSLVPSHARCR